MTSDCADSDHESTRVVHVVVGQPERGEAGRGGDGIPRQRAGLVDRAVRRQLGHDVGATTEGRGREAAAHHLAERHQVRAPALAGPRRGPSGPSGVTRKPVITSSLMNSAPWLRQVSDRNCVEARLGRDDAHVARRGLGDDAGDARTELGERGLDGGAVVVRQHDGVGGDVRGDARRLGEPQRDDAGAGLGEQRVDVAVVAAGELDDHVAAGEAAGQTERRHRRLGAGRDEPHLVDRRAGDDLLGELDLGRAGRPEGRAARRGRLDRRHDLGVRVAEQHRAPRADQVDDSARRRRR